MDSGGVKKVAIIGAGPSGLAAARYALQCGLEPTIFESADSIGGVFRGPQASEPGLAWSGMQTNVSQYTMHLLDQWPKRSIHHPFCTQHDVYEYLRDYAAKFDIERHILLQHTVVSVKREQSDDAEPQWLVQTSGKLLQQARFHFLVVASGRNGRPFVPKFVNESLFAGKILHSSSFATLDLAKEFANKRVVAIGAGVSGADMVPKIAKHADCVVHVIRRAPYWLRRCLPYWQTGANATVKRPWDLVSRPRYLRLTAGTRPEEERKFRTEEENKRLHEAFAQSASEQFAYPPFNRESIGDTSLPPSLVRTDNYLDALKDDALKHKLLPITNDSIKEFYADGVVLNSGKRIACDAVFLCTGYSTNVRYFDAETLRILEYDADDPYLEFILYKLVFRPELPNLAFVGIIKNAPWMLCELQARWAAMTFSGKLPYPDRALVEQILMDERKIRNCTPRKHLAHDDIAGFADSLAADLRVLPDFERLKTQEPALYEKLWFGPILPEHFALEAENSREIIENVWKYMNG